jgi:hypothetical protein
MGEGVWLAKTAMRTSLPDEVLVHSHLFVYEHSGVTLNAIFE